MKNIKLNLFSIYFLCILFLCGYIKIGIITFLIVLIHELGHVFMAYIFHYKIIDVVIYPFGGITRLEKDVNTPVKKEILLACGGVLFQILLMIIGEFLPISLDTKILFRKYNLSIMFFNILPIIPLDGSIILQSILNKFFSFKKAYIIYVVISIIMVILYVLGNWWWSINNYLIISVFLCKIYTAIKNYQHIHNRFLLERFIRDYDFKNISTKTGSLDILKIDTYQYFREKEKICSEKEKLKERFDKY